MAVAAARVGLATVGLEFDFEFTGLTIAPEETLGADEALVGTGSLTRQQQLAVGLAAVNLEASNLLAINGS